MNAERRRTRPLRIQRTAKEINHRPSPIRTVEGRRAVIDALRTDHPANVADQFGLKRNSLKFYLNAAKAEVREELSAQGLTFAEIEERVNRIFCRDGCTIRTIVYGEEKR